MTILETIIENKRKEVAALKKQFTRRDFEQSPLFEKESVSLKDAILASNFGIIAEIKRKSPSVGNFPKEIDPITLAQEYQAAGAAAISVLTDFSFFGGSVSDLKAVKQSVSIPVLRKEFIIDEIQLFEAKAMGADAVLLIAEVLTQEEALYFTIVAQGLGLEVLMEFHEKSQLSKINDQVDLIGVNNRNLKLQKTDLTTSFELIDFLPKDVVLLSESGIKSKDELQALKASGFHGALIGESILLQDSSGAFIHELTSKSVN